MKPLVYLVVAGCAAQPLVPAVRFANAPAVAVVDDRRDVPVKPDERMFLHEVYHYDGIVQRRITRALELPRDRRALGVNALDEVPDSTWFTNRIGVRDLSLDEIRSGPIKIESPELHKPWTIRSTKVGGSEIGFVFSDARGEKYLLKFDPPGFPEVETATHVIVNRLLWAAGYNVPEDHVVYVTRDELLLAADATLKDALGEKHPLDRAELDRRLAQVERSPDGRFRGMASRWLEGKTVGGPPAEGVRDDDPNDRIPHQLRRDLRGAYSIFAWLDHVDLQESNFLDVWVKDPRAPKHHYLEHYLIDFGKSLGGMASIGHDLRRGHAYVIDIADMTGSLVTAGAVERAWEHRIAPPLRGVALFDADSYDPGTWKQDSPAYVPALTANRIDKFWGAKILMRFTRDQIRAAVDTGRLSDPRAADYITNTLIARQRATAHYWFARVNPLDHVAITGGGLCFDDLMLAYHLEPTADETRYAVSSFTHDGRPITGRFEIRPTTDGHACTSPLTLGDTGDGYTIVRIETIRPNFTGETYVHVARDPGSQTPRVIGLWRP